MAIIKPPSGIDPTTDWSDYASRMGVSADTDKKRKAVFALGVGSIFKTNEDLELTKATQQKILDIEKEQEITDSIIDTRFKKRDEFEAEIITRGGKPIKSTDVDGNITYEILNSDRVLDSFKRDEILLAQENLPLQGYSKQRQLSNEARNQAISKAEIRYDNFINNKSLYNWNFRTATEAKSVPNKYYRQAKNSLNKKRYADSLTNAYYKVTGNYVEDPHVEYIEGGNAIRDLFTTKDTEYSKNVTRLDRSAVDADERGNKEIISQLEAMKKRTTNESTIEDINNQIKLFEKDAPPVLALSPDAAQIEAFRKGVINYQYGLEIARDVDGAVDKFKQNYAVLSLTAGGNHDRNVLFFASLPTETNPDTVKFLNPSERIKAITKDRVDTFLSQQKEQAAYPFNDEAQKAYVEYQTYVLQNATVSPEDGVINLPVPPDITTVYRVKLFNAKRKKIVENYREEKDPDKIATLENDLAMLHEQFKKEINGNAYTTFQALQTYYKTNLTKIQSGDYDANQNLDSLANEAQFLTRVLDDISKTTIEDNPHLDQKIVQAAQKQIDDRSTLSIEYISKILALRQMTGLNSVYGNASLEWFKENGFKELTALDLEVASEADIRISLPDSKID